MGEEVFVCKAQREEADGGFGEALEEKVKRLELEIVELKLRRTEDAKANEKVANLFSTQEQSWISEKRSLRRQIQVLFAQFRMIEAKKEETISSLNKIIEEKDTEVRQKIEEMEKVVAVKNDYKEKLNSAEAETAELREKSGKESNEHSRQLSKHKTVIAELVSSRRQLEAEMGRVVRQAEATKQEFDQIVEQKEEVIAEVDRLLKEISGLRKDGEQKDRILSAMLRKSKLDVAEKQMLLKELKASKARRKQVECEAERWKIACEPRRRKGSKGIHSVEAGCSDDKSSNPHPERSGVHTRTMLLDYLEAENWNEKELSVTRTSDIVKNGRLFERCSNKDPDELVMIDIRQLQDWLHSETDKYISAVECKHCAEIEAFTEQIITKDEKLEGVRWKLLNEELEVKRLQSLIFRLDSNISDLKDENMKIESWLLNKEKELKSIEDNFNSHIAECQKNTMHQSASGFLDPQTLWMELKIKGKPKEKDQETNVNHFEESKGETGCYNTDVTTTFSAAGSLQDDNFNSIPNPSGRVSEDESGEEKEVNVDPENVEKSSASPKWDSMKTSPWKIDINSLGVSYKIKRLKQQLLMVEKLIRKGCSHPKPDTSDERKTNEKKQPGKGFQILLSLLNKQVKRYQSLEEKINDLCKRMNESEQLERSANGEGKTREQISVLERFLEETFHLQRYMVATGQKLMEIQSRITSSFVNGDELNESTGFNMGQFIDIVRCLLREIQRGLEVRITRIIGEIGGTLARDGIIQTR